MTLRERAASLAAMALFLAGLLGTSTPGLAFELDRTAVTAAALANNSPTIDPVPAPSPSPTVTAETLAAAQADGFDTLDEAVAAQDMAATDESLRCLAGAVYFESKGEPLSGQLAVAEVIINRAKSGRFPADLCAVVKQRGQFSFVRGGELPVIDAGRAAYRTAMAVAKVALHDAWDSPAANALFFHARRVAPAARMIRVAAIGNHVFYR